MSGHATLREVERSTKTVDPMRLQKSALAKTAAREPDPTEVSNPLKALAK
jgi:hypothetical protein